MLGVSVMCAETDELVITTMTHGPLGCVPTGSSPGPPG